MTKYRALAVLAAIAAALLTWTVAAPLAGAHLRVHGSSTEVGPAPIVATSLVAGLAAWSLLAFLERSTANPARNWTAIALIVLVVSLAGPLTTAATTPARLSLTALHLVVAAVLIPTLRRSAADRQSRLSRR